MKRTDKDLNKIVSDILYTHKQNESNILAQTILNRLQRNLKAQSRGTKESRFFVLRNNLMPAVLIEIGFLSNMKEEKLLSQVAYRQKVAQSIAEGVLSYAQFN